MERSKQIQIGLLALVGLLLIANLFGGGFKNWLPKSEGQQIKDAAASSMTGATAPATVQDGNIPGTNVNTPQVPAGPATTIRYDNDRFEFGVADEGEVVKHEFKFTNTGKEPLVISNCRGSCGCTVPTWPREPIPAGASGVIHVEFNTKGKPGNQSKRVTVTANTIPTETYLEVSGEVRGKDQPAAAKGH
jgi:hypothetical protein